MTDDTQANTDSEKPASSSGNGWKIVTLRMPPEMHNEAKRLAGTLQAMRGENMSLNSLINEAIEQYLKRHRNPKMLKDFEGL